MKRPGLVFVLLLGAAALGCHIIPEAPPPYDEEVVLQVWNALAAYYGENLVFECEYLRVHDAKIQVAKPYLFSDIAVVTYFPRTRRIRFFRRVCSDPRPNEFSVDGSALRFSPPHEGQNLFVAWVPDLSEAPLDDTNRKRNCRR